MFSIAAAICGAIMIGGIIEFLDCAKIIGGTCLAKRTAILILLAIVLPLAIAVPVFAQDNEKEGNDKVKIAKTHAFSIGAGPMGIVSMTVDTASRGSLKLNVLGDTITIDIDTNIVAFDTVIAIIDSAGAIGNMNLGFGLGNAFGKDDDDDDANGMPGIISSTFDPFATVLVVGIVFVSILLLFLGIPLLLFLILLLRWKWTHKERMRAIEEGIVIPPNGKSAVKSPIEYLRKGLVLFFVGLGFIATIYFIGGVGGVIGVILAFWGLGILIWYFAMGRKVTTPENE